MKYSKKCEKYNYDYWTHYLKCPKNSINFQNICLVKCFEIFPKKKFSKIEELFPKNLWKYMDTEHIIYIKCPIFKTSV